MSVNLQALDNLGLSAAAKAKAGATDTSKPSQMGQDMFLKLMMTQLEKQNPLKPQDSSEFLSQLAQFTMVTGIQELQDSFSNVASTMSAGQALQASSLVGKRVMVESNQGVLGASGGLSGALSLDANASNVKVEVVNAGGATVRTLELGDRKQGNVPFTWDGLLDDGVTPANPGTYRLKAEAVIEGETVALAPHVAAPVQSVTLGGSQGIEVDLGVLGRHKLADILEVLN
jgi:flagellar basal-body rod modification protein FlgD